jgi:hypothetical protein
MQGHASMPDDRHHVMSAQADIHDADRMPGQVGHDLLAHATRLRKLTPSCPQIRARML